MRAFITGGTGFLGKALAIKLKSLGYQVTASGRNEKTLKELELHGVLAKKIELADKENIINACQHQDIVFHVGALSSAWGPFQEFYHSNVIGTKNVVSGCEKAKVKRLIYVSTPSIYFRFDTRVNVTENSALPNRPTNDYVYTKLLAETEIDTAFANGLPVISIRPRAIFGEGDNAILPRLISRLRTGNLRIIGDAKNITDITYIDNVVNSLLLCAEAPSTCFGKKYNITNDEPLPLWSLIKRLCDSLGYEYPKKSISYPVAMTIAGLLEFTHRLLPGQPEPLLTKYMVSVLAQTATLDISAAKRDLGYAPKVSIDEGIERFTNWWKKEQA